jgi:7-keto-8-aminopelargonate synthetase-like enzyme
MEPPCGNGACQAAGRLGGAAGAAVLGNGAVLDATGQTAQPVLDSTSTKPNTAAAPGVVRC